MIRKNIDYIITMTKDFIDGNLDCLTYCLDYNHELIQRWDKMTRVSPELADMVNFYLFQTGFDTVNCEYGNNEATLRRVMKRQYKKLMDCINGDIF